MNDYDEAIDVNDENDFILRAYPSSTTLYDIYYKTDDVDKHWMSINMQEMIDHKYSNYRIFQLLFFLRFNMVKNFYF